MQREKRKLTHRTERNGEGDADANNFVPHRAAPPARPDERTNMPRDKSNARGRPKDAINKTKPAATTQNVGRAALDALFGVPAPSEHPISPTCS